MVNKYIFSFAARGHSQMTLVLKGGKPKFWPKGGRFREFATYKGEVKSPKYLADVICEWPQDKMMSEF